MAKKGQKFYLYTSEFRHKVVMEKIKEGTSYSELGRNWWNIFCKDEIILIYYNPLIYSTASLNWVSVHNIMTPKSSSLNPTVLIPLFIKYVEKIS